MKITEIRAVQPLSLTAPDDWRTKLGQILIAVDTDAGITGYGVGGGGKAGIHVVESVLRDLLLDQSPEPIETHWQRMYQATLPFGRKGLAIMALSGVDLALWDLKGKAEQLPVANLLSDKITTEMPTYTTIWEPLTPNQAVSGQAFKLHVKQADTEESFEVLMKFVEETRRKAGPDTPLMVDAWMQWDVPTSLKVAQALKAHNIGWLEEPLPADDFAGYAELVKESPIPIAGGEHEFTAAGFQELIDGKLHAILQPDVCWCGGLTELIKIYAAAKTAGLQVCPHRGAELWGLHAIAALDPDPLAESGRPWMTWVSGQPPINNGRIQLPDRPGFGVEIDEEHLRLMK